MPYPSAQIQSLSSLLSNHSLDVIDSDVDKVADILMEGYENKLPSVVFGNGGSATDSQHFASELICTFNKAERTAYPLISLASDSSILTAWSNDFDFSGVFARQISAFGSSLWSAIGISTSGTSASVINALTLAKSHHVRTILLTGSTAPSHESVDLCVRFPSSSTPIVQTLTQLFYHSVAEIIEHRLVLISD